MVGKNLEVDIMDESISALSEKLRDDKQFTFCVSVEFAQSLLDYVNDFYFTGKVVMQIGDEFTWKGFNCKVI